MRTRIASAHVDGARILTEPTDWEYGERQYVAEDPAGHRWTFSETLDDVAPAEWGGTLVEPGTRCSSRRNRTSRSCHGPGIPTRRGGDPRDRRRLRVGVRVAVLAGASTGRRGRRGDVHDGLSRLGRRDLRARPARAAGPRRRDARLRPGPRTSWSRSTARSRSSSSGLHRASGRARRGSCSPCTGGAVGRDRAPDRRARRGECRRRAPRVHVGQPRHDARRRAIGQRRALA